MTNKITIERETVQAALRALDYLGDSSDYNVTPFAWQAAEAEQACTALRAALAAQPTEPVAWMKTTPPDHLLAHRRMHGGHSRGVRRPQSLRLDATLRRPTRPCAARAYRRNGCCCYQVRAQDGA